MDKTTTSASKFNSISSTASSSTLRRYVLFWWLIAANNWQEAFVNRATNALFMLGKVIRLAMSLLFLLLLKQNISVFAGYTTDQIIVFFLTYQFIDTATQVVFRGVYLFSNSVRSGDFDFALARPISPLFQALTSRTDINDLIFIGPTTLLSIYLVSQLDLTITIPSLVLFLGLLVASFLIAASLHILVLCVNLVAVQVDSAIWLYRDLAKLGQFPIDIYFELLRFFLFLIVPIGVMVTIPSQVLVGVTPTIPLVGAFTIAGTFFALSLVVWSWSLRQYGSASS